MKTSIFCCAVLLFLPVGCSVVKKSVEIPNHIENISVQKVQSTEVSINRIKDDEGDRYDFHIALLDESREPYRIYFAKGFRGTAKAQFYGHLNSVIISDEGTTLYALVVDKNIEYRFKSSSN